MDWKSSSAIVEAVLAPAAITFLLYYHAYLLYKVRTCPMRTTIGIDRHARRLWVYEMLTENHKKNVLAVQTLRNSIMESALMAATATLLIAALATYFTFTNKLKHLLGDNTGGPWPSSWSNTLKSLLAFLCLIFSFLCHTLSIHFYNNVNYIINVPTNRIMTTEYIAIILEKAIIHYALGSRALYIGIPILLWVFGPAPMFLCTIFLLNGLYKSDFNTHFQQQDASQQSNKELGN